MAVFWFTLLVFAISLVYASVGQAGGSGYLAAMALLGMPPAVMKPTALLLNILVALVATTKFSRAGSLAWATFWPFAATSVPAAFVGGRLSLTGSVYNAVVGVVLLYAAYRLVRGVRADVSAPARPPAWWLALVCGSGVGLLSGFTGIGGGVVLGPLLLAMGWAETRQALGISAAINLSNSVAGLLGHLSSVKALPGAIPLWAAAALIGGWIGAEHGSRRFSERGLQWLLAAVLSLAALRLIIA
jgi:uncharacterized membrane protein YfcA